MTSSPLDPNSEASAKTGASAPLSGADIVGHKTFYDSKTGYRHEPLTRAEADELLASVEKAKTKRAADMPTDQDAIRAMWNAHQRLRELGWREAIYCPKDGSSFEVIEAGSTGIHRCHYSGEWPKGSWWIEADGDLSPSRPVLFRPYPEDEARYQLKKEEARKRYAQGIETRRAETASAPSRSDESPVAEGDAP